MEKKLPKFTLKGVQHRIVKLDITSDVIIGGEVVENYPVSWVRIRGSQDPVYQKAVSPYVLDYRDEVEDAQERLKEISLENEKKAPVEEEDSPAVAVVDKDVTRLHTLTKIIEGALHKLLIQTVVHAIQDWDEEFFGMPFTHENAYVVFSDDSNNGIYNQIGEYMKEREAFLPIASV